MFEYEKMINLRKGGQFLRTLSKTMNGKYVVIDTCYTADHGYETMVFKATGQNGTEPESWSDIDAAWYESWEEARLGHLDMIEKWQKETLGGDYD